MRLSILVALVLCGFVGRADESVSEREVWNEGVDFYLAGDMTNALKTLRPLMVSKAYAARAAEVVAKIEFERDNRDEAAYAAQIALRANPKDARAVRNFTRATDGLLRQREEKRVADLVAAAAGKDPAHELRRSRDESRELLKESSTYMTNAPARMIRLADRYEERAKKLADEWIVLGSVIEEAVTNAQQAATIRAQLEQSRKTTLDAAREFGDLDAECYSSMSGVEHDFTRFYKMIVMPPEAIDEDLIAQSNAMNKLETINEREWQNEALEYTRVFRAKFPQWARQYEEQASSNTNMPPFTAQAQGRIAALATELEKVQLSFLETPSDIRYDSAFALLKEIKDLLPKNDSKNPRSDPQSDPQAQPQTDPQSNDEKDEKSKDENKEDAPPEDKRDDSEQKSQEPQKDEKDVEKPQEESDLSSEDEDILKKALERNDEHEAAKRSRMRKMRRPPNERDW